MLRDARGQASVETVSLLPLVAVLAAGVWQAAVCGHAVWSAGAAARAASRAVAVGADAGRAASRVARGASVVERGDGSVRVTVPVRAVAGGATLARFSSTARFEPQR